MIVKPSLLRSEGSYMKLSTNDQLIKSANTTRSNDIYSEKNVLLMYRLSKQTQKRFQFTSGQNRQEDARLHMLSNIMEKNYNFEDNNWLKEFVNCKKKLKEIKVNTNSYSESTFDDENVSSTNSKLKQNSFSNYSSLILPSQNVDSKPSASSPKLLKNERSKIGLVDSTKRSEKRVKISIDSSQLVDKPTDWSLNSLNLRPKTYNVSQTKTGKGFTINQIDNLGVTLDSNYYKKLNTSDNVDATNSTLNSIPFDNSSSLLNSKKSDFKSASSCSSSSDKHINSIGNNCSSPCNYFPCHSLKSYTSILNSTNDRTEKQLETVCLNVQGSSDHFQPISLLNLKLNRYPSDLVNTANKTKKPQDPLEREVVFDNFLQDNKSIRRALRQSGSTIGVISKLRSLQVKAQYCREQKEKNFQFDDRNIRYGNPKPKKNISRQLKVLSQFETLVK